jgi:hypothetical protein
MRTRVSELLPLRSSTAEQPVDNRQTVERNHAEGPIYNAGWLRQMSGGLKIRRGWRDTNSSDPFCVIDVTATCESSKLDTPGQLRLGAPIHAPVADVERHLFCKQDHVSANLTGGPISSRCFPWCNSSTSLCERDGAGAEPAGKPIFSFVRKAKSPSQWFASPLYPVRVRGARPLCFRGVRVMHATLRRWRLEVQILAEAPFQRME